MPGKVTFRADGIGPIVKRFSDPQTAAGPVRVYFKDGSRTVRSNVQQMVRVKTGDGKRSVRRSGISRRKMPTLVKVFTRRHHMRMQEFGTSRGVTPSRGFLKGLAASRGSLRRGLIKLESNLISALRGSERFS